MITNCSVEIAAPAALVWDVFSDVARWPEWTASIERVEPLDGASLALGRRFAIKQPRLPNLVWQVDQLATGASWSWRQAGPGATSYAVHEVVALDARRTLVRQRFEQRGPIGALLGRLFAGMTRRYLRMEADGLKAACEARGALQVNRSTGFRGDDAART
jgi:uncharacterized membrane protein